MGRGYKESSRKEKKGGERMRRKVAGKLIRGYLVTVT